jgi:hypothetical protein
MQQDPAAGSLCPGGGAIWVCLEQHEQVCVVAY